MSGKPSPELLAKLNGELMHAQERMHWSPEPACGPAHRDDIVVVAVYRPDGIHVQSGATSASLRLATLRLFTRAELHDWGLARLSEAKTSSLKHTTRTAETLFY
jgi:hypothetical protein